MVLPWTSVSARETLRVGAFNYQPGIYQDTDGVIKGFFVDLLDEVARKQGWTIQSMKKLNKFINPYKGAVIWSNRFWSSAVNPLHRNCPSGFSRS
jgi:ABC-type amino acid transport substrate-binding protein